MHKYEVAHILRTIASLLRIKGEQVFKVRAYEKAAHTIAHGDFDLEVLTREHRLKEVPGIGRTLESEIHEIMTAGRSSYLEELAKEVPVGLLDLVKVPGIGPKTARTLYEFLGISDLDALESAVETNMLQKVPGLGPKREALIGQGLKEIKKYSGRITLGLALPTANNLVRLFSQNGIRGTLVGEVTRTLSTVSSIEILLEAQSAKQLVEHVSTNWIGTFSSEELWNRAWSGKQGAFVFTTNLGIPLKVHVAPKAQFGLRSILLTGPCMFSNWIAEFAKSKGYAFESEGFIKGGTRVPATSEAEVFETLGIGFVPAEVRHRKNFLEKAICNAEIRLVELSDIQGDLHLHTTWSDGLGNIEQMARKAIELGYSYIAITDHATRIKVIDGLNPVKIKAQLDEISKIAGKYPEIQILSGVEVDILKDGSLALSDDLLSKMDIVVASVHQDIRGSDDSVVKRLIRAVNNPHVDIIGHPTGRLIGRRPGTSEGFDELFKVAAANSTVLEINASPDRLDLNEQLAQTASACGARLAVCTDAHSPAGMDDMVFGIASSARRAGLTSEAIINTQPLDDWFPIKKSL